MAVEKEAKRKKVSKKSKKSWRKHTDIADIEEHLEEVRHEQRTGGPISEKSDAGLFFVDKETKEVKGSKAEPSQRTRKRKLLKSDELLLPDTNTKPVGSKRRKTNKKLTEKPSDGSSSSGDEEDAKHTAVTTAPDKPLQDKTAGFDLWGSETVREENLYLSSTKKKKVKMPKTLVDRAPSRVPAVEVCVSGASYNPDFDSHQALLKDAVSVEATKAKNFEKVQKKMRFLTPEEAQALPTWQEEMSQGLFGDEEKDENEAESSDSEEEDVVAAARSTRADYRKTKKERRKEEESKAELRMAQLERQHKSREQEVFRLKTLKKEIRDADAKANERKKKKEEKNEQNADKPKRLGRHKYEPPNIEVQLSEELTGNLRSLKHEGNLFQDRFKSLQRRNLLEPRKPVVPHRKHKRKEYEKKNSKKPCIKEI